MSKPNGRPRGAPRADTPGSYLKHKEAVQPRLVERSIPMIVIECPICTWSVAGQQSTAGVRAALVARWVEHLHAQHSEFTAAEEILGDLFGGPVHEEQL